MKLTKSLFLAFAGLGLFACSNEDVTTENGIPSGNGAVTVQLINPGVSTRTVQDPTTGNNTVAITGNIVVKLYEKANLGIASQTITIPATSVETNTVLKFWNVTEPGKITVSINNGQSSYAGVELTSLQGILPANVPAYGETTKFILTNETGSPIINNDNDNNDPERPGNKQEQGASEGDQNKVYQLYNAKVTMAIPVARLEVSGITHKSHPQQAGGSDVCEYKKLTIKGVYMDNLYTKGGAYQENSDQEAGEGGFYKSVFANGTELADYCWKKKVADDDPYLGTGEDAILKDEIPADELTGESQSFLESGATWPKPVQEGEPAESKAQVFAYNFYPASNVAEDDNNLPKFKIYFDSSESQDATKPLPAPRYAMITKYWNSDHTAEIKAFEPGKIYRITSAELKDGNIIGDEGGNTLYGVEVTVKEAVWTPVNITADWAE